MSVIKTRLKKSVAALLTVVTLGAAMTVNTGAAEARWRRGPAIGLGIVGGLAAGALIAGATRPAYAGDYYGGGGGYYAAPPAYAYDEGPVCHIERQRVYIDDYTYRIRKVRVCY